MKVLPLSSLAAIGPNKIAATEIAGIVMGRTGSVIIACLIMVCTFGALNGCVISYPRVYYRMAQENAFFKKAAAILPVSVSVIMPNRIKAMICPLKLNFMVLP